MIKHNDIAEKLNISRTTVARALNGSSHIKPETKVKVLAVAKELGYEVNHVSSALATHHKKLVYVFLVSSISSKQYAADLQLGLEQFKRDSKAFNFDLQIIHTAINNPDQQVSILQEKIKNAPKGIIIIPLDKDKIFKVIEDNPGITFISLGVSLGRNERHVGTDYYAMGRLLANVQAQLLRPEDTILLIETAGDEISSKAKFKGMLDYYHEHQQCIEGPYYFENIFVSAMDIGERLVATNAKSIQSNRYISEMVQMLQDLGFDTGKVASTGLTELTRQQLQQQIIRATVVEKSFQEGYLAGSLMFDILIKKQIDKNFIQVGFDVIFKESLFLENRGYI